MLSHMHSVEFLLMSLDPEVIHNRSTAKFVQHGCLSALAR